MIKLKMSSKMDVIHAGRPFGVPNDGLAIPALRRRKSKNRSIEKLTIVI